MATPWRNPFTRLPRGGSSAWLGSSTLATLYRTAFFGAPPADLTLTSTEPTDVAAASVGLRATFALTLTESTDTLAATLGARMGLVLTTTDPVDTLVGVALPRYATSFTLTEARDTLAATLGATITGGLTLAATEPTDTLAATASRYVPAASLTATEARDIFAALIGFRATATLTALEPTDSLAAAFGPPPDLALTTTEPIDAMAFTVQGPAVVVFEPKPRPRQPPVVINDIAARRRTSAAVTTGGGARIFFQPDPPLFPNIGDLWYDSDNDNIPYRWDGAQWVNVRDLLLGRLSGDTQTLITRTNNLSVAANDLSARIDEETTLRITADSAEASQRTLLATRVGDAEASIATLQESTDGVLARWSVTLNVNGEIAGISLLSEADGTGAISKFKVLADQFEVANPGFPGVSPFSVVGGQVRINGSLYVGGTGTTLGDLTSGGMVDPITYVGAFATAPDPTPYATNSVYRNTTDGNTYIKSGSAWVIFLEKGATGGTGPSGSTGPQGEPGIAGAPGVRGSRQFFATGSAWSDAVADAAIVATGFTKVILDQVTISNGTNFAQSRFWNGSAWLLITATIDGNLLVNGTVGANKLIAGTITAGYLNVATLSSITANLGTVTAGTLTAVTINSSTLDAATLRGSMIFTANSGPRAEIGRADGLGFDLWIGTGTKNTTNGTFYVTTSGNVVFSGTLSGPIVTNANITPNTLDGNRLADGTLAGGKLIVGSVGADRIDTRNLTIRDGAGNILFGAGTPLSFGNITPAPGWLNANITLGSNGLLNGGGGGQVTLPGLGAGAFATLNQINGANISTYIAAAAIADAYIANLTGGKILAGTIDADRLAANLILASIITLTGSGHIKAGQSGFNTGTGFFLGFDGGVPKFSIGTSSGARLVWDGTSLTIVGDVRQQAGMTVSIVEGALSGTGASGNRGYGSRTASVAGGRSPYTYDFAITSINSANGNPVQCYLTGTPLQTGVTATTTVIGVAGTATNERVFARVLVTVTDADGRIAKADFGVNQLHGTLP